MLMHLPIIHFKFFASAIACNTICDYALYYCGYANKLIFLVTLKCSWFNHEIGFCRINTRNFSSLCTSCSNIIKLSVVCQTFSTLIFVEVSEEFMLCSSICECA